MYVVLYTCFVTDFHSGTMTRLAVLTGYKSMIDRQTGREKTALAYHTTFARNALRGEVRFLQRLY